MQRRTPGLSRRLPSRFDGIRLKVRRDGTETSQRAIVVGSLERGAITNATESIGEGEWCLTADTDRVYLLSKTEYGYQEAQKALIAALEAAKESCAIIVSANTNTKKNYEEKKNDYDDV